MTDRLVDDRRGLEQDVTVCMFKCEGILLHSAEWYLMDQFPSRCLRKVLERSMEHSVLFLSGQVAICLLEIFM